MSLYQHSVTQEIRDFDSGFIAASPKGYLWSPYTPPPAEPKPVLTVRSVQLRQWLIDHDLFDAVVAILDNAANWPDEATQKKAQQRWEFEVNYDRDDELLAQVGVALGLSSAEIDTAFSESAANYP